MIKNIGHPWYGHTGVLGRELSKEPGSTAPKDLWTVKLDNGMNAGCYIDELEAL